MVCSGEQHRIDVWKIPSSARPPLDGGLLIDVTTKVSSYHQGMCGFAGVVSWDEKYRVSQDTLEAHIPFIGALLKTEQDVDALSRYDSKGGKYPARWADLGPRFNQ